MVQWRAHTSPSAKLVDNQPRRTHQHAGRGISLEDTANSTSTAMTNCLAKIQFNVMDRNGSGSYPSKNVITSG